MRSLFLVHWNQAEALSLAQDLQEQGVLVEVQAEDGQRARRRILEAAPIYLARLPSRGLENASCLRSRPAGVKLPIFLVDGSDESQRKASEKIAGVLLVSRESISAEIASLAGSS